MDCRWVEERLSGYLEDLIPESESEPVAEHLRTCTRCTDLYEEMRLALAACQAFPVLDPDRRLVDRILRHTSGKKRWRRLGEFWPAFWRFGLLPRFAAGAALALLLVTLLTTIVKPDPYELAAALSPGALYSHLDRRVQELYGDGLRAYEQKNRWQAEFKFMKDNAFNKVAFMIARFDMPAEGEI